MRKPKAERAPVPVDKWEWFGNAGHFICGYACRFHMTTKVGRYIVSTVGQLWFDRAAREIHARIYDPKWYAENVALKGENFDHAYMTRFGYEAVGCDRTFETMVFVAGPRCTADGCACGMPTLKTAEELDFAPYNDAGAATRGHMAMCAKWAKGGPR